MNELRIVSVSDVPLTRYELVGKRTLNRWCQQCKANCPITLPAQPSGLGRCTTCGCCWDLCDTNSEDRTEYINQYEPVLD